MSVDDFVFKRKRKLSSDNSPAGKPIEGDGTPVTMRKHPRLDGGQTPQEAGYQAAPEAMEMESSQTAEERKVEAAAQEILAQIPEDFSPEDQFMAICELACQREIEVRTWSYSFDGPCCKNGSCPKIEGLSPCITTPRWAIDRVL